MLLWLRMRAPALSPRRLQQGRQLVRATGVVGVHLGAHARTMSHGFCPRRMPSSRTGGLKGRVVTARELRVATVDNFQGEEAKIIILSTTRNNKDGRGKQHGAAGGGGALAAWGRFEATCGTKLRLPQ